MTKKAGFTKHIRIYDKRRKISQKISAIPICRLEWASQDPQLFPGLAHALRSEQFNDFIMYLQIFPLIFTLNFDCKRPGS